ncbi:hypothetical protein ACFRH6_12685 [Streptomyces sp. NPDC056749]
MRAVPLLRLWSHTQTRASWLMVRRLLEAGSGGGGCELRATAVLPSDGAGALKADLAAFISAGGPRRKPHRLAQVQGYFAQSEQPTANAVERGPKTIDPNRPFTKKFMPVVPATEPPLA